MHLLAEFLSRCAGPVMFTLAVSAWLLLYGATNDSIEWQKQEYADGSSLSLRAPEADDSRVLGYGELTALLAEKQSVDVRVSVPSQFYQLFIHSDEGEARVIVMQNSKMVYNKVSRDDELGIPLSTIPNYKYRAIESYTYQGELESITYAAVEE